MQCDGRTGSGRFVGTSTSAPPAASTLAISRLSDGTVGFGAVEVRLDPAACRCGPVAYAAESLQPLPAGVALSRVSASTRLAPNRHCCGADHFDLHVVIQRLSAKYVLCGCGDAPAG
jgi:hypothetical protein